MIDDDRISNLTKIKAIKRNCSTTLTPEEEGFLLNNGTLTNAIYQQYLNDLFFSNLADAKTWYIGDQINIDPSFVNTSFECLHDKMILDNNDFYFQMIEVFNQDTHNNDLTFKVGNLTPNRDLGQTSGFNDGTFEIKMNSNHLNSSNLLKEVGLVHEVMHVYMFRSLEASGYITFLPDGSLYISSLERTELITN